MRKFVSILLAVVVLALAVSNTNLRSIQAQMADKTIADIVVAAAGAKDKPEFTILLAAVQAADPAVLKMLSDKEASMTVFAPTDAAFAAALKALNIKAEDLLKDKATLGAILAYHVVPAKFDRKTVAANPEVYYGTYLPNTALKVTIKDGKAKVNDSNVAGDEVVASNGIIHVIDAVLLPPDAVLKAMKDMKPMDQKLPTFVDALVGRKDTTTLVAAVKALKYEKALSGTTAAWTVFAPTDKAFEAALKALNVKAEDLLKDTKTLGNIVNYHVVPGAWDSKAITALSGGKEIKAQTLAGIPVTIKVDGGKVMIDKAVVAEADAMTAGGIAHIIDGVLVPAAK